MPRILIDANPSVTYLSTGRINGISRTNIELIKALDNCRDILDFDICLYSQNLHGTSAKKIGTHFKTIHCRMRNIPSWNKIASKLRVREILGRYDLQHITHNFEYVNDPSRCIVTIHDVMYFSYPEPQVSPNANRRLIPPFAQKARHIITISENSKREIMEHMDIPEEKITVIPWGVDHDLLFPHSVPNNRWCGNSPYFIAVSCDTGRKNTVTSLRAYDEFARHNTRHQFILVWRKPSEEALNIASKSHLSNRVHFVSNVSNKELADLYAGATASFFPSLYEGFGLPVLESMACGVPCVTCRNSSLEEVGGDAAIYVEALDVEAMADIMTRFEENEYNREQLKLRSIQQASEFTWERCSAKTIEVYRKCLGL